MAANGLRVFFSPLSRQIYNFPRIQPQIHKYRSDRQEWRHQGTQAQIAKQMTEQITSSPDRKRARTESRMTLQFAKMSEEAFAPTKGSKLAAGYDLYSAYDYEIEAKSKQLCKTDIQIALPDGCYGRVAPRSGLAHKHFIDVGAGVIDQDYRGNVGVILFNFNDKPFNVKKGDRIAQLICERIFHPELEELKTLTETERGEGGFGSTGISLTSTNGTTASNGTTETNITVTNGGDATATNGTKTQEGTEQTNGADSTSQTETKESS